jgi:diguanylate cyclase (GGDEF)-like protein
MKVLVLDKNLSDLQAITLQLKQLNFDVLHSINAVSALTLYQSYSPDIIVMDPDFPEMHGYNIVKEFHDMDEANVPVLFISHNVTSDDIISGIAVGGEYLHKPVNASLLKAKLHTMQRMIVMRQRYIHMSQQLQKSCAELKQFTHIDNLTGLINRTYLDKSIQAEIARGIRYQQPVALVYVEVDCFRQYREHYGLQKSDLCLKQIADILSYHCRRSMDITAHCGAELFALVFPDTPAKHIMNLARRICEAVESAQIPHQASSVADVCTVTIGVTSSVPQQGEKKENLFRLADSALNQARKAGNNCAHLVNFYMASDENMGSTIV